MRLIDAEPIIKSLSAMKTQLGYDAIDIDGMIKALREAEEVAASEPPNAPLTLEQLREMEGEPVWVVSLDGHMNRWAFVWAYWEHVRYFTVRNNVVCEVIGSCFKTYGKTWIAYRRKPEDTNA